MVPGDATEIKCVVYKNAYTHAHTQTGAGFFARSKVLVLSKYESNYLSDSQKCVLRETHASELQYIIMCSIANRTGCH